MKLLAGAESGPLTRAAAAALLGKGAAGAKLQSADQYLRPLAKLGLLEVVTDTQPLTYALTDAGSIALKGEDLGGPRQLSFQIRTIAADLQTRLEALVAEL